MQAEDRSTMRSERSGSRLMEVHQSDESNAALFLNSFPCEAGVSQAVARTRTRLTGHVSMQGFALPFSAPAPLVDQCGV